jgi:hypothetical protein
MADQASTYGLATKDAPFKLTPFREIGDYEKHVLENKIGDEKRKVSVPIMDDPEDKEGILRCYDEFLDASAYNRLRLTVPQKFTKFRELLQDPFRAEYDTAMNGMPETEAGFQATITAFLAKYFDDDDLSNLQRYLLLCKKPNKMSVTTLEARLKLINKLAKYLPESHGHEPYTLAQLKVRFVDCMPQKWVIDYSENHNHTDPTQTWDKVARYMKKKEKTTAILNRLEGHKRSGQDESEDFPTTKRQKKNGNIRSSDNHYQPAGRQDDQENGNGGRGNGNGGRGNNHGGRGNNGAGRGQSEGGQGTGGHGVHRLKATKAD